MSSSLVITVGGNGPSGFTWIGYFRFPDLNRAVPDLVGKFRPPFKPAIGHALPPLAPIADLAPDALVGTINADKSATRGRQINSRFDKGFLEISALSSHRQFNVP